MNNAIVPRAFALVLVACASAAFGCGNEAPRNESTPAKSRDEAFGSTPATNKPTVNNEQAIQSITGARCERETRCNNVGQGKTWATAEACRADLLAKNRNELRESECPVGIVQKELDECLADIRNEKCDNPLDTIGRLAACRSSDMCKATGL